MVMCFHSFDRYEYNDAHLSDLTIPPGKYYLAEGRALQPSA